MREPGPPGRPSLAGVRRDPLALLRRVVRSPWGDRRSLRVQLTLRVWAAMIVLFAVNNALQIIPTRNDIANRVQSEQKSDADYLAYGVHRWAYQIYLSLLIIRNTPLVQRLDQAGSNAYFNVLKLAYPAREFALYDHRARLVARSPSLPAQTEAERRMLSASGDFQDALGGRFIYSIGRSILTGQSCLLLRAPVLPAHADAHQAVELKPIRQGLTHPQLPSANPSSPQAQLYPAPAPFPPPPLPRTPLQPAPVGVLSLCLPLARLGQDSGLADLYAHVNKTIFKTPAHSTDLFNLETLPTNGGAFLLLANDGHLLFPSIAGPKPVILTPDQLTSSRWGPFIRAALTSDTQSNSCQLTVDGLRYILTTRHVDPVWSLALIVDRESAFRGPDSLLWALIGNELLVLLLAALVIQITCAQAATPIQQASSAIRRLASGQLEVDLPVDRSDEIGQLYRDIHDTATQLRTYLAEQTTYAITREQIETARSIQHSFLLKRLPASDRYGLAVCFKPALEVAGDWYDVMVVGEQTYLIVADVCDKGVGAALFMSVFRTLLRYEILRMGRDQLSSCADLVAVLNQVNGYMADNHADAVMFATLFVASLDPRARCLSYICAGHEQPYVRRHQFAALERLEVTGPALGVFPQATFAVRHLPFEPGDILLAYTDGLPDSRSPEGASWGLAALEALLADPSLADATAQEVLDRIYDAVRAHMNGADPFDDLTLLAVRAL